MMKQRKAYIAVLGALLLTGQTVVDAQEHQQSGLYLNPSMGYYFFDEDENNNAEDGFLYGLSIGYQVNNNFALELNYSGVESEVDDTAVDTDGALQLQGNDMTVELIRLDGIFNLDLSSPWSPYLAMGYARLQQDPGFTNESEEEDMMDLGLGIKQSITPALSWKADARAYHNFDNEDTDYGVQVGVSYLFGATPPPPPPVMLKPKSQPTVNPCSLDDDQDGVDNCADKCSGTPLGSRIDMNGCRIEIISKEIELKVLFDFDRDVVKSEYYNEIQQVADFMREHQDTTTELKGYADSIGTVDYNIDLSQRRANAVRDVLINEFGIDPARLTTAAYGESMPVANNVTPDGRQQNRRVIAHIRTVVEQVEEL